jgi:hypothetical protein
LLHLGIPIALAANLVCAGDAAPIAAPPATQAVTSSPVSELRATQAPPATPGPETATIAAPLRRHTVPADGHPIAVYSKVPPRARAGRFVF